MPETKNKIESEVWHVTKNGDKCAKNHAITNGSQVIAKFYGHGYPVGEGWSPESEANARLASASPQLLRACINLLDIVRLQNGNLHDDINELQRQAEEAIAKARGE